MDEDMEWLTLAQAGELFGINPATLRQQILAGKLEGRKLGSLWVTRADWVQDYKAAHPRGRQRKEP